MPEGSWPFYGTETNETQFSKWARTLAPSGIADGLALTPGSGMSASIAAGTALVRGVFYENTTAKTLAVGAAPAAGLTRRDAVILRLDQTANTITALVKAGSANSSGGTLPSLTQDETTWELLLGVITVVSGTAALSAAMISENRPSTGLRVLPYTTANRPNPAEPVAIGINTSTRRMELWISGGWVSLADIADTTGTLAINRGGTGATSAASARTNLGAAAEGHTHAYSALTGIPSTFAPAAHNHSADNITSGVLPIARGGTGATTAAAARTALGASPAGHTHDYGDLTGVPSQFPSLPHNHNASQIIAGVLAISRGGTGVSTMKDLREALDIYVQPSAPAHKKGRVWIPGAELA